MRPRHWAKNLLVFVPLLTAHAYDSGQAVMAASVAFLSFCLCASGVYFFNDLLDLEADRNHATKCFRPLASGALSVPWGIAGAIVLPGAALALAGYALSLAFAGVLAAYFVLTNLYSLYLKRVVTADVVALSVLYMVRVLAGAVAIQVALSSWLLAFCIFLFISLAYLKRYIEVRRKGAAGEQVLGRGYFGTDEDTMFALGIANGTASILVFALFVNSPEVAAQYGASDVLWVICLLLIYWTNRMWIAAQRGYIEDDPVDYAIRDRVSQGVGLACVAVVVAARYLSV
jgi:4-hydroxybenzoate polyprenyltransferase